MCLSLLTKFVFGLLLFTSVLSIAQTQQDTLTQVDDSDSKKRHFNAEISGVIPFAIGDNFASKGFNFRYGLDLNFRGYFNDQLFIGLKFQHLRAEVKDKTLIGFFEHSNVNSYFVMAGYRFDIYNNMYVEPYLGYGSSIYKNKKTSTTLETIDFQDEANSLIIASSVVYKISKDINIFLTPEYRIDYTKIITSQQRQSFFDQAKFFNVLVGIRFGY